MLQLKNIRKEYHTGSLVQKALDGVSLNLRDNEFVAILGPSGSGKTTLLNIIGGLDRYDSGDLIINGVSTRTYKDRDWDSYRNHTIGFIFQSYNLIPHQNLLENVELALTIAGITGEERKKRAQEALEQVGLGDQSHKLPSQLSGGQMQRVAIARALVNNPDIVLADEPTGALDSVTSVQVMELLKQVARDRLVVMVTHNPDLAHQYATRIVNLKDGRITSDSDPLVIEETAGEAPVRKLGRASMPFRTALQLSFRNLKSKLSRTLLVAFAGSIGIIGIGLVQAISDGVKKYIKDTEEQTLSEYPLEIERDSFSMQAMMMSSDSTTMYGMLSTDETPDDGKVHEIQMLGRMLSNVDTNDLASLKEWIESGESGMEQYAHGVEYIYDITPQIYLETDAGWRLVNPNTAFSSLGFSGSSSSVVSSATSVDVFFQLPSDENLYLDQYEILAGHLPENDHECMLVLSTQGGITDMLLYAMGLKDPQELDDYIEAFASNESFEVAESDTSYTYDELMAVTFRMIYGCDAYVYDESLGIWSDQSGDTAYLQELLDNGETLQISGIMKCANEEGINMLQPGIYYTSGLVDEIRAHAADSAVVQAQLADPETNVLTGNAFGSDAEPVDFTSLFTIDEATLRSAFSIDTDQLQLDTSALENIDYASYIDTDAIMAAVPSLSAEEIAGMLADLNIEISADNLQAMLTELWQSWLTWGSSQEDAGLHYADLPASFEAYLNSEQGQAYLNAWLQQFLQEAVQQADLSQESLNTFVSSLQEGYTSYCTQWLLDHPDEADQLPSWDAYLQTEEGQSVLADALQVLAQDAISQITISSEDMQTFASGLLADYTAYAQANDLPDPSRLQESFQTYLATEEAQTILTDGVSASLNLDDIQSQIQSYLNAYTAQAGSAIAQSLQEAADAIGSQITAAIRQSMVSVLQQLPSAFSVNTDTLASSFHLSMEEGQLEELIVSMLTSGNTTLRNNLKEFGYIADNDLDEIDIYPYDFESKQAINDLLADYNQAMADAGQEESVITYTDLVGTLMTSVTDIVNTISYILVAFVAISLVVSSIMIGVITYISVLERRKEIGILRAMGASKHDVASVFNAETFITGLLAGFMGIGICYIAIQFINPALHNVSGNSLVNAYLPIETALELVGLSVVLTLIGGLIPSQKAAHSDPVAALRAE